MIQNINLLTTTRCNLNCIHCLRGSNHEVSDFPLGLFPNLLSEARLFGANGVDLTGGEPGLHPSFGDLIGHIVDAGYTWCFVTNGQETTYYLPYIKQFKESLTGVYISLDGANAVTHDTIRRCKGAFEAALKSISIYKECDIPVHIKFTATRINKDEILDVISLSNELAVDTINFGCLIPTENNLDLAVSDLEKLMIYDKIVAAKKSSKLKVVSTYNNLFSRGGVLFCKALLIQNLAFNSRGEMIFCCDVPGDGHPMGSLNEMSLADLIERKLMISAKLQSARAHNIATGVMPEGFDHCQYCIDHLT